MPFPSSSTMSIVACFNDASNDMWSCIGRPRASSIVDNPSSVWFTPRGVTSRKNSSSRNFPTLNASAGSSASDVDFFLLLFFPPPPPPRWVSFSTASTSSSSSSSAPNSSSSSAPSLCSSSSSSSPSSPPPFPPSSASGRFNFRRRATSPCPVSFALSMCLSCAARFACIALQFLAAAASSPFPFAAFAISASNTVAAGRYLRIA
mmetsp:Transcript_5028/g.17945  ORF Transcript_5028/g.17945 Transcript_5028/m.17945 type:complete len:205 (-) Transcript_5028:1683-2297(-)